MTTESPSPTSEITKYEALLLMLTTATPEIAFQRNVDAVSSEVVCDLVLVNTFIAQPIVVNEIECRAALLSADRTTIERQDFEDAQRMRGRGPNRRHNSGMGMVVPHGTSIGMCRDRELEALCGGTDVGAFTKYIHKQMTTKFSGAFCRRLDKLSRGKALAFFSEREGMLDREVMNAQSNLAVAKAALENTLTMQKINAESQRHARSMLAAEEEEEVNVF